MNSTERLALRRAQLHGIVVPPTKAISAATLALVKKGYLVITRNGFEITEAGYAVDTREPKAREADDRMSRRT